MSTGIGRNKETQTGEEKGDRKKKMLLPCQGVLTDL